MRSARLLQSAAAFRTDRHGGLAVLFAVSLPALIGLVALGIETGSWYATKRNLQTAADAAAISGAWEKAYGNASSVSAAALQDAMRNGFDNGPGSTFTVNTPPTAGAHAGNVRAVEVVVTAEPELMLASAFLETPMGIEARAVAVASGGDVCLLALRGSGDGTITAAGTTQVAIPGCYAVANSSSERSIDMTGSAELTAFSLYTVGNVHEDPDADIALTEPALTYQTPMADPYAGLTIPGSLPACVPGSFNDTRTISAGTYCELSFGPSAHVTLNPGTYYVDSGNFEAVAGAEVECSCAGTSGVTIVLTTTGLPSDIGTATIAPGSIVELKAPSGPSYDYPGILLFQDDRASGGDNLFEGGSEMRLTGSIYFPVQRVHWSGNTSVMTPECTQIVADRISFTGNSRTTITGCGAIGLDAVTMNATAVLAE